MRKLTTVDIVETLMKELGRAAKAPAQVFFTGGVTAIMHGWREATVDVDIRIVPESDEILRVLPELKERLNFNIELAAPDDFIPQLPGWRQRCLFIANEGPLSFFHYDPYSQALSKLERRHAQDLEDVLNMLTGGLVEVSKLADLFDAIEPDLYRYPAIDPKSFRAAVTAITKDVN